MHSNFAADLLQHRARSGYIFHLSDHGACSYNSTLMPTPTHEPGGGIAKSTVEADTVALANAIKDSIHHLKTTDSEILGPPVQPLLMWEDNQGAIIYAHNAVISECTTHIDVK